MAERHHLVPRFYLARWGLGGKKILAAIRRSTGEIITTTARNAAVDTDTYAVTLPEEGKTYLAERVLGRIESDAALALARMLRTWPPSEEDRWRWSALMGLQVTRGLDFRQDVDDLMEWSLKLEIAMDSRAPESMRQRLTRVGLEPTEENLELLREMMDEPDSYNVRVDPGWLVANALKTGLELTPYFMARTWSLRRLDRPILVTADQPVGKWSAPGTGMPPFNATGLASADEVRMPLDPSHLLLMTLPGTPTKDGVMSADETGWKIITHTAHGCREWVYGHPKNPLLDDLAVWLKGQEAPRLVIGGPSLKEWAEAAVRRDSPQV